MRRPGRARNDHPSPPSSYPKTDEELRALLEKTWQDACDAELERCDEEHLALRAAVVAFDDVVLAGASSFDRLKPPRLQGCSAGAAVEFARRVRKVLDAEPRVRTLEAFEAAADLSIDEISAKIDGMSVRALRENPAMAGVILNNLRLSLEQLDDGRKRLAEVVESMDKTIHRAPEAMEALLAGSVRRLYFSTRAQNCMNREGVKTVRDLCALRSDYLLGLKNFGPTTLAEVREKLAKYGLALADGLGA